MREAEQLQCDLSLDHERLLYELRTRRLGTHDIESIEHYRDVGRAFRRQSAVERALVEDGWSLARYEQLRPGPNPHQ